MNANTALPRLVVAALLLLAAAGCSKLTPENYANIKVGMPFEDVKALLGSPDGCNDVMGVKTCTWTSGARRVTVTFASDQVLLYTGENLR